jgi:ABC-type nitrate/sulfonate/bicarbonate transport system permease component
MAYIATIGVLGFACDALLRALNRKLTPWRLGLDEERSR